MATLSHRPTPRPATPQRVSRARQAALLTLSAERDQQETRIRAAWRDGHAAGTWHATQGWQAGYDLGHDEAYLGSAPLGPGRRQFVHGLLAGYADGAAERRALCRRLLAPQAVHGTDHLVLRLVPARYADRDLTAELADLRAEVTSLRRRLAQAARHAMPEVTP